MKIICEKSEILKGIRTVSKAVSVKSSMSIIECILIECSDDEIKLTANNMEFGIETKIKGTIEEKGVVALEARILQEIISHLSESDVTITTDSNNLTTIVCEKSKFNIVGRPGDDFPVLPDVEKNEPLIISEYSFKEIVKQTYFSVSESESNKMMSGELIEINNNKMTVTSLDGHRISIRKIELNYDHEDMKAVVPGKTLNEVTKIISGDTDKDIEIYFTDKHLLFEFDETRVVSRIIEGEYFKVNQMLSNDYETKFDINKKSFTECIERSTLLVKEGDKKPIIIDITDENMELKINSTIGSLDENIDIEKEGRDIKIGFNPKFLIEALRVIDEEVITVYMVNPKAPCIIKDEKESYIYLILPVNFNTIN
ncbi:MAG: DNA polymerase III subunit beta [Lachnospiraceae bacterium]|nr:DNA polymerase III subunit beta [Lachnospiraceae bacterium]